MAAFVVAAAALAGYFPVQLSVAAVFLFAGPHNWLEARYFVSRMPVRWAGQRAFFLTAASGVVVLSVTFSAIAVNRSIWHSAAAIWILLLLRMTRREALSLALPIAFLWMAFAWAAPGWADLALVFLHPLMALWFVHRQIVRTRPEWLPGLRITAAAIAPLALLVVALRAHGPVIDDASMTLSFSRISATPALLSLHAFLELLHYGAWVILLPAIGLASAPWNLESIPLVRHRKGWPRVVRSLMLAGAAAVAVLWVCFALDYRATRDIYFTIAVVHVMAEAPMLAWLR